MTRTALDRRRLNPIKYINDFNVGKLLDPVQSLDCELARNFYLAFNAIPIVIRRFSALTPDVSDN
jgi:hypothetical protein